MTPLHSRLFDFNGCVAEFRSADKELADWLAADFAAFPAGPGASPEIRVTAETVPPPRKLPRPLFRGEKWHLLSSPRGRRVVWYPEGAMCEYNYHTRQGRVISGNRDLLKELSYLLILSRAGEALDRRELHRLHSGALGFGGSALLFCGAQGAGKTTLLLELLKDKEFSLLSDDTPLISRDGTVHKFPARIGLGEDSPHLKDFPALRSFKRRHYPPKRLLDIGAAGLQVSGQLPPAYIFKLCRGAGPAFRKPARGQAVLELAKSLVAGWGVPQMAEYFLRASPSDLAAKAMILLSRIKTARALIKKTVFMIFETGPDHAANAAALKSFLRSSSGPA